MLHEIIITLSGVSSKLVETLDYFIDLKPFLHPSEAILLKKILIIAKDYKYLKDFVDTNHAAIFGEKESALQTPPGLYIQAFCEGLEQILKPYRNQILQLEENVLMGPPVTLTYVYSKVDSYSFLFVLLTSLVRQIISQKIHGCQILQLLHEHISSGIDQTKEYLECILKRCHVAFLKQTTNWLINGNLIDSFEEYVIRKSMEKENQIDESDSSTLTGIRDRINERLNTNEYEIAIELVPQYINYSLVNDILFVGQIVRILNESSKNNPDLKNMHRNMIFGEKEEFFFKKFLSLKKEMSFDMRELEQTVHDIRECVVKHLWKLAVEEENLYDELQLMKNFYLLGHGQFFKEFLLNATLFSLHSKDKFTQDLNVALYQTASSFPFMDEEVLKKFKFIIIPLKNPEQHKISDNFWSYIKLQYLPKWPLNLLFTPVALQHYNKLFLFMLRTRRCQIELQNVWKNDIKNKDVRCSKAWKLRNELMFLIDNLQYYLQVDVIETEYSNLMRSIQKVQDFQQIQKLHNMFLLNVLSHSFLLDVNSETFHENEGVTAGYSEYFYNSLLNNMKICEKFCFLASKGDLEKREKEIIKLDKNFQKHKNIVFCFLAEYQSQPFKQHVSKLLLRLNFNKWINKHLSTLSRE